MSDKSKLFSNVYVHKFSPEDKRVIRDAPMPKTIEEVQEEIEQQIENTTDFLSTLGVDVKPRPLTEGEAKSVIRSRQQMIKDCDRIRKKVKMISTAIDQEVGEEGFTYSFKRKPRLRQALKSIVGKAKNNITYEDYRLALEVKKKSEAEETASFFQDEEE